MLVLNVSPIYEAGEMRAAARKITVRRADVWALQESYDGCTKLYIYKDSLANYKDVGTSECGIGHDSLGYYLVSEIVIKDAKSEFASVRVFRSMIRG